MKILRTINIILLSIFVLMVLYGLAIADTHTADSCSLTHVQAAVDAAARGDTVSVPAGECSWTSRLSIDKAITLQGAGAGSDNVCDSETETCITFSDRTNTVEYYDAGNDCIVVAGTTRWYGLIRYVPSDSSADENEIFRITGFGFYQSASVTSQLGVVLIINKSSTPLRKVVIDNNRFQMLTDAGSYISPILNLHGYIWGVVHSNTFDGRWPYMTVDGPNLDDGNDNGTCYYGGGKHSWETTTYTPGTSDVLFFEDNTYNYRGSVGYPFNEAGIGGKGFVARYNTYNYHATDRTGYTGAWQLHAAYITSWPPMGLEVYGNYSYGYSTATTYAPQLFLGRAGKLYGWNNLFQSAGTNLAPGITLRHECDEEHMNTSTTHACGADTLYPGANRCTSDGQPPHVHKSYFFQNRYGTAGTSLLTTVNPFTGCDNAATLCGSSGGVPYIGEPLRENLDWWKDNSNCSGTTCYTGIGCGTTLPTCTKTNPSDPDPCPAGVGFWLTTTDSCTTLTTDNVGAGGTPATKKRTGTLYRRQSSQWVAYYTPAAYPHALRSDVPEDTTAPSITNLSPTAEQVCDDLDDTEDIVLSLVATDQTQASVACYYDTETRADYAALAASGHEMTASGTTFSATAAGLACATTHTIWYACSDGTTATDVGTYTFNIAAREDSGAATVTNNTTANQACAAMQKINIATNKPATAKFCKAGETVGEGVCDADTTYADMPHTFSVTGGETGHVAHSTDVTQACSSTVTWYVRTSTTQGVANTSSTAIPITTDAAKTVTITGSGLNITIGTGSNTITIVP